MGKNIYHGTNITRFINVALGDGKLDKRNTSGKTGVWWYEKRGKWLATICFNYKQIRLGYFDTFEEAAKARDEAEAKYFYPVAEAYLSREE